MSDDEPPPPQDVSEFASGLFSVKPHSAVDFDTADMMPMAQSLYSDNTPVGNVLIKEGLGVTPKFPTYREGLRQVLGAI